MRYLLLVFFLVAFNLSSFALEPTFCDGKRPDGKNTTQWQGWDRGCPEGMTKISKKKFCSKANNNTSSYKRFCVDTTTLSDNKYTSMNDHQLCNALIDNIGNDIHDLESEITARYHEYGLKCSDVLGITFPNEEEKRIAEEKKRIENEKKVAEEKRLEEEKKRVEQERLVEEERKKELARLEAEEEFKKKNTPKQMGSGSGFFINSNGYIASNFHVTDGCLEVRLGTEVLEIVRNDIVNDIAILKSNILNKNYIKVAENGAMKGEDVFVLGFPHGKHLSSESKVTKGVVSALQGLGNNYSQMQIDAAIQPGNSGGPVINSDGELIGVTVATADYEVMFDMFKSLPQNMNFAIKSQMLTNILDGSKISYETSTSSWFSFGSNDVKETVAEVDKATVYLECWSTEIAMKEAKESAAKLVDTVNSE